MSHPLSHSLILASTAASTQNVMTSVLFAALLARISG